MKKDLTPELWQYCIHYGNPKPPRILELITANNQLLANGHMQISQDQAFFIGFLAQAIQAASYLEIGIFTGYSLINMALALPDTAIITALELEQDYIATVQANIARANEIHQQDSQQPQIRQNIEYIVGDAANSLPQLISAQRKYDLIFIDANKSAYLNYYLLAKKLLSHNGILLIDNVFKGFNDSKRDYVPKFCQKVHELNLAILADEEIISCMLPIADGLTLVKLKCPKRPKQ